ncbi:unnamed protein product [Chondrus crispus]|uniref:TOG domain-containing protein n=1 Tax=Chondrus crispus TaxID=2769 RepID=R7QKT0_CHOCR|nr:unnamed protein product [Chondrus crispus]CDF38689.1 unnamed protein product [Chondrus crispus]|eukprot:XP_005718594.1 unnamed protein product [Chondrus crispus]
MDCSSPHSRGDSLKGQARCPDDSFFPERLSVYFLHLKNENLLSHLDSEIDVASLRQLLQKNVPTPKTALSFAMCGAFFCKEKASAAMAMELMLVPLGAIERGHAKKGNSQKKRRRFLHTAYFKVTREAMVNNETSLATFLLDALEASVRISFEGLAAVGLLAAIPLELESKHHFRVVKAVVALCMKSHVCITNRIRELPAARLKGAGEGFAHPGIFFEIQRALARQPEVALPAICSLFRIFDVTVLATEAKVYFRAVEKGLKGSDEKMRAICVQFAASLGHCIHDEKVFRIGISLLLDCFKVSKYAYQKIAIVRSLRAYVSSAAEDFSMIGDSVIISTTLDHMQQRICDRKAVNDDIQFAIVSEMSKFACWAMVRWLGRGQWPSSLRRCSTIFVDILTKECWGGAKSALLTGLTGSNPMPALMWDLLGETGFLAVQAIVNSHGKASREDCLRSITLLVCSPKTRTLEDFDNLWNALHRLFGRAAVDSKGIFHEGTADDVRCALFCCKRLVAFDRFTEFSIATTFRFCLHRKAELAKLAILQVRELLEQGVDVKMMFAVLWGTQFEGDYTSDKIAVSGNFGNRDVIAERIGNILLAVAMPGVPSDIIPAVAMAANHPRICAKQAAPGCPSRLSRYWVSLERNFDSPDNTSSRGCNGDWLDSCITRFIGPRGLFSEDPGASSAAFNALRALAHTHNPYSNRVFQSSLMRVEELFLHAVRAVTTERVEESGREKSQQLLTEDECLNQQRHAAEAYVSARGMSNTARITSREGLPHVHSNITIENREPSLTKKNNSHRHKREFHILLEVIQMLVFEAPKSAHGSIGMLLSLVAPLGKVDELEVQCRRALHSIVMVSSQRLKSFRTDICTCLYGLGRGVGVVDSVSRIIVGLKRCVPPFLEQGDFSLVMPILRETLLRGLRPLGDASGARMAGSRQKRSEGALVKGAIEILLEQSKPEAIDSAIVAVESGAGAWAISALEREDEAFVSAAEVLVCMTSYFLTPGTGELAQVLRGALSGNGSVRAATLASIGHLPHFASEEIRCPHDSALGRVLWLSCFDTEDENARLSQELWKLYRHPLDVLDDTLCLLTLLQDSESDIRAMAAKATAASLETSGDENLQRAIISKLFEMYLHAMPEKTVGSEGNGKRMSISEMRDRRFDGRYSRDSMWVTREGVALTIKAMSGNGLLVTAECCDCFEFLLDSGLLDPNEKVQAVMKTAASALARASRSDGPSFLIPLIELRLNQAIPSYASEEDLRLADGRQECLISCLADVAQFLSPSDSRISLIAQQMMKSAVATPSELVQNASGRCLVPLAKAWLCSCDPNSILDPLMSRIWDEEVSYGVRRGASCALAGVCHGMGLNFMKRMRTMSRIKDAVSSKSPHRRQTGLILVETHALIMGRKFEPFIVATIPLLLSCMGDSLSEVRNACWAAARASMAEASSHGVSMILPSLVTGLRGKQWRTKAGSAQLLGAMAFCAPRQLSQCLPEIVPILTNALTDVHPRVIQSSESALSRVAAVIKNPEIRNLSPFLLAALRDPTVKTKGAIDGILSSEFMHTIDTASLALLVPLLHRALRDRSSDLKKKSAAIIGSICGNVSDPGDVFPYLDMLLRALRMNLFDAIPEVRLMSAQAIGALAASFGEESLDGLVQWLLSELLEGTVPSSLSQNAGDRGKGVTSSVERSGAAMGLAEITTSLPEQRLRDILSKIKISGEISTEAREGGLLFIASVPQVLGERFENEMTTVLDMVLKGLADDADSVRDAALKAGRSLVTAYAISSRKTLLGSLLSAMRDNAWRIRLAGTQLLGNMLLVIAECSPQHFSVCKIPGATGYGNDVKGIVEIVSDLDVPEKKTDEDQKSALFDSPEDAAAALTADVAMTRISLVLESTELEELLAALYIVKCDTSIYVRQAGVHVWKTIVSNSPRTLRDVMPAAIHQIVNGLANDDEESRVSAGRALGDLAQKLGERVVPAVLPILKTGLKDNALSERQRHGACEGVRELVRSSPKLQLQEYAEDLIGSVCDGLRSELQSVRETAGSIFSSLLRPLGNAIIDDVIPGLIEEAADDETSSDVALDALSHMLLRNGHQLMPCIVSCATLQASLTAKQARVLTVAATVAPADFKGYVAGVTSCLVDSIESSPGLANHVSVLRLMSALISCCESASSITCDEILLRYNETYEGPRIAAGQACIMLCRSGSAEQLSRIAGKLLDTLIRQLADSFDLVTRGASQALSDLCSVVPSATLVAHIPVMRRSLRAVRDQQKSNGIRGCALDNRFAEACGLFFSVFSNAVIRGEVALQEQAALAIGELLVMTELDVVRSLALRLCGPLIRAMSDRIPWQVKVALLTDLTILLRIAPSKLRTFSPQLQNMFLKSLNESSPLLRGKACLAFGALAPVVLRIDALLQELISVGIGGLSPRLQKAALESFCQVLDNCARSPGALVKKAQGLLTGLSDASPEVRHTTGLALAAVCRCDEEEEYMIIVKLVLAKLEHGKELEQAAAFHALGAILSTRQCADDVEKHELTRVVRILCFGLKHNCSAVQSAACGAGARLISALSFEKRKLKLNGPKADMGRLILREICAVAESAKEAGVRQMAVRALESCVVQNKFALGVCVESIVRCMHDPCMAVRTEAEKVARQSILLQSPIPVDAEVGAQLFVELLSPEDFAFVAQRIPELKMLTGKGM